MDAGSLHLLLDFSCKLLLMSNAGVLLAKQWPELQKLLVLAQVAASAVVITLPSRPGRSDHQGSLSHFRSGRRITPGGVALLRAGRSALRRSSSSLSSSLRAFAPSLYGWSSVEFAMCERPSSKSSLGLLTKSRLGCETPNWQPSCQSLSGLFVFLLAPEPLKGLRVRLAVGCFPRGERSSSLVLKLLWSF